MLSARKVRKPVRKARKTVRKVRKTATSKARKGVRKGAKATRATVRSSATVASVVRRMQRELGLPEGAVCLSLPTGRRARGDKTLGKLREAWGK